MAKKERNTGNTGNEKKTPAESASRSAKESGEIKGPMGVGGRKKPDTKAKPKEPSKITQADKARSEKEKTIKGQGQATGNTPAGDPLNKIPAEEPKKGLPEKTSHSEEHLVVKDPGKENLTAEKFEKKASAMKPRDTTPIILEENSTASLKKESTPEGKRPKATKKEGSKKDPGLKKATADKTTSSEKGSAEGKETPKKKAKPAAKKMSRRKPVEGISAEEKTKLTNTTTSDALEEKAKAKAKELLDQIIPDKETTMDLKEKASSILTDKEKLKEAGKMASEKFAPDMDTVAKLADKILPRNDLIKKAKEVFGDIKEEPDKKTREDSTVSHEPEEATLLSEYDVHLFREGKHYHLYKKFGSHPMTYKGTEGVYFAVWAPNAQEIYVIGDFNEWDKKKHPMKPRQDESGIWEAFIPEAKKGSLYKYFIRSTNGFEAEKGDPFAFLWENPPNTASIVWDLETSWNDDKWMSDRDSEKGKPAPMAVYEMHLGSWKRKPEEDLRSLTYKELAEDLPSYLKEMGFTHVEFMPVMEHPFFGSWGYQITGYFAPSSRFGTPQEFMALIDSLHREGIGVILDWVPSHFPSDLHGLHYFDGTFLYEHQDKKKGFHPDWQSYIFNYGRNEVRSFLISNSLFWLDKFHVDGLRVDAVASMLYLDYSRKEGEWDPNEFGGRENLEAISFLKEFNEVVYREFPDTITIAEESTAWPMVSRPTYLGGLGFGQKWMMGWMHDTLSYFQHDPIHRKHHQDTITFSTNYAFTENFMLPLSHDEVVYGKQALLNKMPGDQWNKFANLRSLYAYMYAHPGTKLLFMGGEFGQTSEWNHDSSLDWHLLHEDFHNKLHETVKTLNHLYKNEPAFYENSFNYEGFQWVAHNDYENSVISFIRKAHDPSNNLLVICNFTPLPRENYRLELEESGNWTELFNSDDERFGGSNVRNNGIIESRNTGERNFIALTLPPLGVLFLKKAGSE